MKVFKNGNFISCEDQNRIFKVLVEDEGKIVFTGDEIPEKYKRISEQIDLEGQCIVPAFADTHQHFSSYSIMPLDVREANDFDELVDIISNYAEQTPEEVIIGFGISANSVKERRLADRCVLDRATDKPLCVIKYDGHALVVNTVLMSLLPDDVKDVQGFNKETGECTGVAFYKIAEFLASFVTLSPELLVQILSARADFLAKRGLNLIHTSEGQGFPDDMDVDIMLQLTQNLPQDFRLFFQTMDIGKVKKRNLNRIGGCYATALDGCFGVQDAALREPYINNPNNKGWLVYPQEVVNDFVKSANREGIQVALHAIGDAAVEQAITAYEEALKDFPREDHRHIIIHGDLIPDDLLERAAKINLHFAVQTPFLDWKEEPLRYKESILGERVYHQIPLKKMIDSGLILGNGSDAPCTIPNPIEGIHISCNHPNPEYSIDVLDALRMHTSWAARLSFDEGTMGTLSEGKVADFVVLDKNLLEIPVEKINTTNIVDVYFKGKKYEGIEAMAK